ncbi:MAG: hypothetical protein OHK0015_01520 [Chloroflexi bacterium OHK40]
MSVATQQLSGDDARMAVLRALGLAGLSTSVPPCPALCAEALRAALWSYWGATAKPVYITRLINAAARTLLPWQEKLGEDDERLSQQLRNMLQEMEVIGDVAALPNGRWSPTPPRIVHVPAISRWLLLGGPPSRDLPTQVGAAVERIGVARLLRLPPGEIDLAVDEVPEREWLRAPTESLDVWGSAVLDRSALTPAGEIDIEVYAPAAAHPAATQFDRWKLPTAKLADGCYLARMRTRRGVRAHYIVQLVGGRAIAAGPPLLGDGDVRRLQYALDLLAHNPVRVTGTRQRDCWTFKLQSALPRAEHRLLLALGREQTPVDGKYYPRCWVIPSSYAPRAEKALRDLGISIEVHELPEGTV